MKYLNVLLLAASFATIAPLAASAQPTLPQRCTNDALVGAPAEARVHWTRRCAFRHRVGNPNFWFDSGIPAANGGSLKDYLEYATSAPSCSRTRYIKTTASSTRTKKATHGTSLHRSTWSATANRRRQDITDPRALLVSLVSLITKGVLI